MTAGRRPRVPGVPGSGAASAASTMTPGCHRQARGSRLASASAWLSRCTCAAIAACPPLVKAPPAHRLWVSFIDGSGSESRLDIFAVNVRLIYELSRRGVWTIPVFLHAQGVDRALPGESPVMGAARPPDPQHFPGCAQARRRFTQVIHMVVHSKPVRGSLAGRVGSSGSACRCWREAAGTRDADLARAGMTSPEKAGTGCSPHALQDRRPAYPAACPLVTLIVILPAARLRNAQAAVNGSVAADAGPPTCATTTTSRVRRGPRR